MYDFNYHKASSAEDASELLGNAEDGALLAGGMTLLPTMKQRLASPSDLVDLASAGLSGISVDGDSVTIGAMTTHAEVADSSDVKSVIPSLAALAGQIGDPHVRHKGTIGGSVANNDPSADYPAACLALGATIITNSREISADDYFDGLFTTVLDEGEVITKISFPKPKRAAYCKFPNPASRYAIAGVFVAETGDGVRVAVTGVGNDGVFRVGEMENALSGDFSADAISGISVSEDDMISDIHASADYRAHLVGVMARRAVAAA